MITFSFRKVMGKISNFAAPGGKGQLTQSFQGGRPLHDHNRGPWQNATLTYNGKKKKIEVDPHREDEGVDAISYQAKND